MWVCESVNESALFMCIYLRVCKRYAGNSSSIIDLQVLLDVGKMLLGVCKRVGNNCE